jgi:hypothetical protein
MLIDADVVEITTHVFGLDAALARLQWAEHALHDMHEPIEEIVTDIHRQTLAQFMSEGAALGDPWAELDPSTVRQKALAGDLFPQWPLVATGAMMDSATSSNGPFSITDVAEQEAVLSLDWERDGWNIPLLHQLGVPWRIVHRRAYTTRSGEQVPATSYWWHLPARPFWEATDELADEGIDHIAAWILGP